MRVLVGDSHPIVRAGLRAIVERCGCLVVAEAASGRNLLHQVRETSPEIVLLDYDLPADGPATHKLLHQEFPEVRLIVLVEDTEDSAVLETLTGNVSGCVSKNAAASEIEDALAAVCKGERYLPAAAVNLPKPTPPERPALTARQTEVLRLLAEGQSTKEIGGTLGLSPKTVDVHRAQIMRKLKIYSVPGLVRYALRIGLIDSGLQ